jgi:hypothetical protein
MIARIYKSQLLFITLIGSFTLLIMCNKDDDGPGTSQRIKAMNLYYGEELRQSTEIKYEGENISLMNYAHYSDQGLLGYTKEEIAYPGQDSILESSYYEDNGIWRPDSKQVFEFRNGRMISITSSRQGSNGTWFEDSKYEYLYNDSTLIEMVHYVNGKPCNKTIYEYNGPRLLQVSFSSYYDGWLLSAKETLYYTGNVIDFIFGYNYNNGVEHLDYKHVFLFEQGLLKNVDRYENDSSMWQYKDHYFFTYNSHGNITTKSHESGESSYSYEYIYEKGNGNYRQFIPPGKDYWDFYCPVDPVKIGLVQF